MPNEPGGTLPLALRVRHPLSPVLPSHEVYPNCPVNCGVGHSQTWYVPNCGSTDSVKHVIAIRTRARASAALSVFDLWSNVLVESPVRRRRPPLSVPNQAITEWIAERVANLGVGARALEERNILLFKRSKCDPLAACDVCSRHEYEVRQYRCSTICVLNRPDCHIQFQRSGATTCRGRYQTRGFRAVRCRRRFHTRRASTSACGTAAHHRS
jgi:hypothetical protein